MTKKYLARLFMYQPADEPRKITAVKTIREIFGVGLTTSVAMYEAMKAGDGIELVLTAQ